MSIDHLLHTVDSYLKAFFSDNSFEWLSKTGFRPAELNAFLLAFTASMGTFLGGLFVVALTWNASPTGSSTTRLLGILQGLSGGVMLFITCFDLIPEAIEEIGSTQTMIFFFGGIALFGLMEQFISHDDDHGHEHHNSVTNEKPSKKQSSGADMKKELLRMSWVTFTALALHNLPEGLGVYLSALSDMRMGFQLALAILLHNIPEGMAVAIPMYAATGSIWQMLWWTFLNGLAEPVGVVIGGTLLQPYLNAAVLSRCLAAVGGVMIGISIHELQPIAVQYAGKTYASTSFFVGMCVCWGALEIVNSWFGHHHHHGGSHHHDHHHHEHHDHHHHH